MGKINESDYERILNALIHTQNILSKITNNGWIRDGEIEKQAETRIMRNQSLIDRVGNKAVING